MNKDFYDAIYLAPHLDDVALSCGGQVSLRCQAGESVLILTIMAGDNDKIGAGETAISAFAQSLHDRWQLANDIIAQRRAEDIIACQILGADYQHWEIPDCIYRGEPETAAAYYNSEESLWGPIHPQENALIEGLATRFADLPPHKEIISPLALGNHVDHQITRRAAEQHFGTKLCYYEDYPYAAAVREIELQLHSAGIIWQNKTIPLTNSELQARCTAVAAYQSQLSTFFQDQADLTRQINSFVEQVGGERIWWQTK